MDPEIKALFEVMVEGQRQTDKIVGNLATVVGSHMAKSDQTFERLAALHAQTEQSIHNLALTVDKYVQAADARMRRIEENLDGLIRAITSEHSNGKPGKN